MNRYFLPVFFPLVAAAAISPGDAEFFEKNIRPVLVGECTECHGAEKQKGGLRLDYRDGWKKGGESGAAIVPGDPQKSLLISSIRHDDPELKMPAKRPKLAADVIANFEKWIARGAPDPRDEPPKDGAKIPWETVAAQRAKWWSLQPVKSSEPPPVRDAGWSAHPVDRFLLAKMESANLAPAKDAPAAVLIRRISYLLTGLPPSQAEVEAFETDAAKNRSAAVSALVERLLASPRFGEQWGRHWLDLVRYAETHGSEGDPEIPEMWRYRDYVIRAMNDDISWDALIREHIAGDLLPQPRWNKAEGWNESALGTAHLRLVEHGYQPVDTRDEQVKVVDSQIDVVTKAFQGITASCARCHDHKFDAVSQRDYTAMAGVFESSRPAMITIDSPERFQADCAELSAIKAQIRTALADAWQTQIAQFPERILGAKERAEKIDAARKSVTDLEREFAEITAIGRSRVLASRSKANAPVADIPLPVKRWSFDSSENHGTMEGAAEVRGGRMVLNGGFFRSEPLGVEIGEKTLEAWVSAATLEQSGGGVLTIQTPSGGLFDSIVFAEQQPRKWMAGSNNFTRTRSVGGPDETNAPGAIVHIAIVYRADGEIAIFRNGAPYGKPYKPDGQPVQPFGKDAHVLIGLRHTGAGNGIFRGEVDEARLYSRALTTAEIAASFSAGPAMEFVAPAEIDAALTAAEQAKRDDVFARTNAAKSALAVLAPGGKDAWGEALSDAEKNGANPLSGWHRRPASPKTGAVVFEKGLVPFRHGPGVSDVSAGDFVVLPEGPQSISALLPAGTISGALSRKLGGIASTGRFKITTDFISIHAAGAGAQCRLIVDGYPIGTNPIFPRSGLNSDEAKWIKLDVKYRKGSWAYLEFSTALDIARRERRDERSWFFVDAILPHDGDGPRDVAADFSGIFGEGTPEQRAAGFRDAASGAVEAWKHGSADAAQISLINGLMRHSLLSAEHESVRSLVAGFRKVEGAVPVPRRAPGVVEADGYDTAFLPRGEHTKPGAPVPRGYIAAVARRLEVQGNASGRLEVASAITAPENPLTARVMVNRIWQHVFGQGIVATPDNFGKMGSLPSHPELLDFMAARFVADGWSLKKTLRTLISTRAFQLASEPSTEASERDPGNALLSHARVRRLPAENIRDTMLSVAGRIDLTEFGPPVGDGPRRSIYLGVRRGSLVPFLTTFDAPKPFSTLGRRDATNVPAQSLTMLNDPFVTSCAEGWAKSMATLAPADRVSAMLNAAFSRPPTAQELETARRFAGDSVDGLRGLAHALMNAKEFIYLR